MPNCFKPESYHIKTIEELNKVIKFSRKSRHERHDILKSQAKRLNFKLSPSSGKLKAAAGTAVPSS